MIALGEYVNKSRIEEGFYQNVKSNPLDDIRDFIVNRREYVIKTSPLNRLRFVNELTSLMEEEYKKFGSFTFQYSCGTRLFTIKIDGDKSIKKLSSIDDPITDFRGCSKQGIKDMAKHILVNIMSDRQELKDFKII